MNKNQDFWITFMEKMRFTIKKAIFCKLKQILMIQGGITPLSFFRGLKNSLSPPSDPPLQNSLIQRG